MIIHKLGQSTKSLEMDNQSAVFESEVKEMGGRQMGSKRLETRLRKLARLI